jgi:hypothetical protein
MIAVPVAPASTLSSSSRDSRACAKEDRWTAVAMASGYTATATPASMMSRTMVRVSGPTPYAMRVAS